MKLIEVDMKLDYEWTWSDCGIIYDHSVNTLLSLYQPNIAKCYTGKTRLKSPKNNPIKVTKWPD
jgi:hypothetical protein